VRLLVLALTALVAGVAFAGPQTVSLGLGMLEKGRYRLAVQALKKEIAKSPDRPALEIGLGRALGELGRCDEGLKHLLPNASKNRFDADAAWAVAKCSARVDDAAMATYWLEFAHGMAEERTALQVALALAYYDAGDLALAVDVVERIYQREPAAPTHELALLRLAVAVGDVELADELLFLLDHHTQIKGLGARHKLRGILELDLGYPLAAQATLLAYIEHHRADARAVQLRIEAIRRAGDAATARALLVARSALTDVDRYPYARAVRARVQADVGELENAQELADAALASTPFEADAVASAWYVARARGQTQTANALAARYELVQPNPLRTLDKLVPPTEPSP